MFGIYLALNGIERLWIERLRVNKDYRILGFQSTQAQFIASLLIGFIDTFGKVLLPEVAGVLVYIFMAMILLWKPSGLFKAGS